MRLGRAGDDEQPRRVAVEAVHDPGPALVAPGGDAGERLRQRPRRVPARGMDDDARGLVDDEQVVVLVADRERGRRGIGLGRRGRRDLDRHRLARAHPVALGDQRAVDAHRAVLDQPLGLRPRAERAGEERVEALAGVLSARVRPHRAR